jgi:NRPS condensation-like uncharacterized protein
VKAENLEDLYRLSPLQQGILFHTLYSPNAGVYLEQSVFTAKGDFNVSAYERAWQAVMDRHPILRTSFFWEGLDNALQVVQQGVKMPIRHYDWRGLTQSEQEIRLEGFLKDDQRSGFELTKAPLMRMALIRQSDDTYQIVWSRHHLLLDRWSRSIVLQELIACYEAFRQGEELQLEEHRPYGDYIEWLQQRDTSEAEAYWRQTLNGFTSPTPLMVDRMAGDLLPHEKTYTEQRIRLSAKTTAGLQSLARQHRLTMNTVIQGAWLDWPVIRDELQSQIGDLLLDRLLRFICRDHRLEAFEDLREVGVFSSELTSQGKYLYFSPRAAKAFASARAGHGKRQCRNLQVLVERRHAADEDENRRQ